MRTLVVGAGGWLARELTRRLMGRGDEVVLLREPGRPPAFPIEGTHETIEVDISKDFTFPASLRPCDVVYNCAARLHPRWTKDLYAVNRDGAARLLKHAIAMGASSYVYISSAVALGHNTDGNRSLPNETHECRPLTHYARSKWEAEQLLLRIAAASDIKLVILRPGVFVGPNPSRTMEEFIEMIGKGRGVLFGKKGFYRSYVEVDAVADAMIKSVQLAERSSIYLLANDPPITTDELYTTIAEGLGSRLFLLRLPAFLSRLAERLAWEAGRLGLHLRLPTIVGEFGRHYVCDSTRARTDLQWKPRATQDAIRMMSPS